MNKEEVIERLKEDILEFFTSEHFKNNKSSKFWPIDNLEERLLEKWHLPFKTSDFNQAIKELENQGLIEKRECIRLED